MSLIERLGAGEFEFGLTVAQATFYRLERALGGAFFRRPPPRIAEPRLLNLGCGPHIFEGWVNADDYAFKRALREQAFRPNWRLDLTRPWNCPADHWDGVFTEHVLEHVSYSEAISALRECLRTMKPGAWLRISVPDVQHLRRFLPGAAGQARVRADPPSGGGDLVPHPDAPAPLGMGRRPDDAGVDRDRLCGGERRVVRASGPIRGCCATIRTRRTKASTSRRASRERAGPRVRRALGRRSAAAEGAAPDRQPRHGRRGGVADRAACGTGAAEGGLRQRRHPGDRRTAGRARRRGDARSARRSITCAFGRASLPAFAAGFRRILTDGGYDAIHDHQDHASGWHYLIGSGAAAGGPDHPRPQPGLPDPQQLRRHRAAPADRPGRASGW